MMNKCPECGSTEIIPDLILFTEVNALRGNLYVSLVDPAKKGKAAYAGFRVAVCGTCGHADLYTRYPEDILDAHKKGYVTQENT